MADTLVPVPLSPFYIDTTTGAVWGPDPNGTTVNALGIKLGPMTPTSSSTDPVTGQVTNSFAPVSPETVAAATLPLPPVPGTAASSSSSSSSSSGKFLGVDLKWWEIGAALVVAFIASSPPKRRQR